MFKAGDKVKNLNDQVVTVKLVPGMEEYDRIGLLDAEDGFIYNDGDWSYQKYWELVEEDIKFKIGDEVVFSRNVGIDYSYLPYLGRSGRIEKIFEGNGINTTAASVVFEDGNCCLIDIKNLDKFVETDYKINKGGPMSCLNEVPKNLSLVLNADQRALYRLGWIGCNLELIDRESFTDFLFDREMGNVNQGLSFGKYAQQKVKEILKKENK